jgi:hypothetical protein
MKKLAISAKHTSPSRRLAPRQLGVAQSRSIGENNIRNDWGKSKRINHWTTKELDYINVLKTL